MSKGNRGMKKKNLDNAQSIKDGMQLGYWWLIFICIIIVLCLLIIYKLNLSIGFENVKEQTKIT